MATLNKSIKCTTQNEVYSKLSDVYMSQSQFVANMGEITRKSFADNLKYHMFEADSLREIFKEREAVKSVFLRAEKDLLYKKEKLWKQKDRDIYKWGCEDVLKLEKIKEKVLKDKDTAFAWMLQKESEEVERRREEMAFFTNQCWDELRRMSNDNGVLLREHYMETSQMMCQFINTNSISWADFQSHFNEQILKHRNEQPQQENAPAFDQSSLLVEAGKPFNVVPEGDDGTSGGT